MKKFNKLLLSAVIALSATMTMSSCSTVGVKDGFGGFIDSISGVIGEDLGNSIKEGFNGIADTIGGWFGAETGEDPETPAEKKVSVTFSNAGDNAIADREYTVGESYTLPTPTKKGHTFEGWFNGETSVAGTGTWSIETNVTLTAKWTAKQYTITLDLAGGEMPNGTETISATYEEKLTIGEPTKAGCSFAGWWYGNTSIKDGDLWCIDDNVTLKAKWGVDITFNYNGAENAPTDVVSKKVNVGESWDWSDIVEPLLAGHTFDGWYLNIGTDDATEILLIGDSWTYNTTATLTAKFSPKTYEVIINNNNGDDSFKISVTYNQKLQLTTPERNGYKFNGWLTSDNQTIVSGDVWKLTEGTTITAQWLKIYKIVYDTKKVQNNDVVIKDTEIAPTYDTEYVEGDSTITLAVIEDKTGNYGFGGWSVNGKIVTSLDADFFANFDGDTVTVVAVWRGNWTKNY